MCIRVGDIKRIRVIAKGYRYIRDLGKGDMYILLLLLSTLRFVRVIKEMKANSEKIKGEAFVCLFGRLLFVTIIWLIIGNFGK